MPWIYNCLAKLAFPSFGSLDIIEDSPAARESRLKPVSTAISAAQNE